MALDDKRKAHCLQYGVFPLPVIVFPHSLQVRRFAQRAATLTADYRLPCEGGMDE